LSVTRDFDDTRNSVNIQKMCNSSQWGEGGGVSGVSYSKTFNFAVEIGIFSKKSLFQWGVLTPKHPLATPLFSLSQTS